MTSPPGPPAASPTIAADAAAAPARTDAVVPRRWTLHGLNNGAIFRATHYGVSRLPRAVSYALGRAGTYIAWRTMGETRRALADNLAAVFPDESRARLEARALTTLRSYADDVIDFLRALSSPPEANASLFQLEPHVRGIFEDLRAQGRGMLLVTGHFGNWEIGSLLVRQALEMPLTVVAMTEADPVVNEIRLTLRERLGADTLEVRQSFDTALQIRRRLADNQIVAMLIDRHYGRDRVGVTMFGRRAWFLRTPLLMAYATGAPLVPCFLERIGPGRFAARPGTPIVIRRDGPREGAIEDAAQRIADAIAERVRARPELWYHFYRYWDAQRDSYDGLA